MLARMRVMVLFDLSEPPPNDQDYSFELGRPSDEWKSEAAVISALNELGHEARLFGLFDDATALLDCLARFKPDVVFNLSEAFNGNRSHEAGVAGLLELSAARFTGARSCSLQLCKDKGIAKKIVAYDGISVPAFETVPLNSSQAALKLGLKKINFPAIVKPARLESSMGIARDSFVENERDCLARIEFVHERLKQDALVEEFVAGREIYVGMLGRWDSRSLEVFPARELFFEAVAEGDPKIATFKAKWDDDYRRKWGIKNGFARDLDQRTEELIRDGARKIYRALQLTGYARLDLRLTPKGEVVFLEANPNPSLAPEDDFAAAALKAGYSYSELIARLIKIAEA